MHCTYHSFNPFRADFEHAAYRREYSSFTSIQGRIFCLIKLALSPIAIPAIIAKKTFRLAAAIFSMLAEFVHFGNGYFNRLFNSIIHVIDRLASLIFSPLNITVARIRHLLGLVHPGIVFAG